MSKIVLHQWEISPFCQKVSRMLRFKGLDFETINYNGILGAKVPTLTKVGKVPVLDINGKRIQDSTRIARYLDETYPDLPLLYPSNALDKVYAELWEDWADELLYFYEIHFRINDAKALAAAVKIASEGRPVHEAVIMKPLLKAGLNMQLKMQGLGRMSNETIEQEFKLHLDRIALVLEQNDWLVGHQQSIADIAVGSQLLEIIRTNDKFGAEILSHSSIANWIERVK